MIESITNSQIKHIVKLMKSAKYRKKAGEFVVEGDKMVLEALKMNLVNKIYLSEFRDEEAFTKNISAETEIIIVSDTIFKQLSDTITPQGVLALVKMQQFSWKACFETKQPSFLCLEDINDPGNLGTMIRTAEGAGMTAIIASKNTADRFNPKVVRATMGSLLRVPYFEVENLISTIVELKEKGVKVVAAHLSGEKNLFELDMRDSGSAILIGNEANGLSEEITELSDIVLKIPMAGRVESLNAAMSAGILMYELVAKNKMKK